MDVPSQAQKKLIRQTPYSVKAKAKLFLYKP
jgi:hypothetical protein